MTVWHSRFVESAYIPTVECEPLKVIGPDDPIPLGPWEVDGYDTWIPPGITFGRKLVTPTGTTRTVDGVVEYEYSDEEEA